MYQILAHEYNLPVHYVCSVNEGHYFVSAVDKNNARFKTRAGAEYIVSILEQEIPHKKFEVIQQ